ncbi:unnamed protein product [Durusdinium trenchii]|uniref:Uncharacterized protein n=1 Tax=Durusdinium trenchii TaxID=1381693 RepID=A0ABP0MYK9_9DINO
MTVPGCPIRTAAVAPSKQAAKTKATCDYVQILQNHGLMQTPAKIQQKRKNTSHHSQPPSKKGAVGTSTSTGPVPVGRFEPAVAHVNDVLCGKIVEALKLNRMAKCVQIFQDIRRAKQIISLKQLAKFADSMGMRTPEAQAMEFFDAIKALDLADHSSPAAQRYFSRFARWAIREFLADAKAAINQAKSLPGHVLERNGCCLQQAHTKVGSKGSQLMVTPQSPIGSATFQRGDWLLLTWPPSLRPTELVTASSPGQICAEAEIVAVQTMPQVCFEVKMMGEAADAAVNRLKDKTCRVDKIANHVTLSRQLDALQKVCNAPIQWNAHLVAHAIRDLSSSEPTWVKHLLLCADSAFSGREAELAAEEVPFSLSPHNPLLLEANVSQRRALLSACGRQLTLIQGPPGTGKTTTALLLVRAWVFTNQRPILCAADSNIAVDNLVDGCAKAKLSVVRVGRPEATRTDLEQYNVLDMVKDADPDRRFGVQKGILNQADVVCCTCFGADHPMIQQMSFARVLLDEAAQATELSALVPLMKMKSQGCVTLVGDHRQLPPTISNLTVDVEGFGTSLFERLASQGVQPYLLNIQYRMHPCISAFPSVMYYKGQILSGVTGSARKPPQGIAWPNADVPVTFLPVAGREVSEGTSWTNSSEVQAVQELLKSLLAWDDISAQEVGIITPYAAQARLLRRTLGCPPPGKRMAPGSLNMEVSSVDGFQGREKDVIIVTTVRANAAGKVGFVGDTRRLNVTLTRAKRGLVVVGCFNTLSADENGWRPWLIWAQERGLIAGCEATMPEAAEALTTLGSLSEQQLLTTAVGQ